MPGGREAQETAHHQKVAREESVRGCLAPAVPPLLQMMKNRTGRSPLHLQLLSYRPVEALL